MTMFFKLLRYDLLNGILFQWKRYLIAFMMFALFCGDLFLKWENMKVVSEEMRYNTPSFGDYLVNGVAGMPEFIPTPQTPFIFPALWVLFYAVLFYFLLAYPYQDLLGFGKGILAASGKRSLWWLSKCVWSILSVALYFLLFYGAAALFTVCSGGRFTLAVSDYLPELLGVGSFEIQGPVTELMPVLFTLPFMVAAALTGIQMTLSLFMKPFYSFCVVISYLLTSAYYQTPFLLGNYAMLLRSQAWPLGAMDFKMGIILSIGMTTIGILVGGYYFGKYDIINKE